MPSSSLDREGLRKLLRSQDGLITTAQAPSVDLTSSALSRQVRAGHLRRVLPLVYADGIAELTERQRVRAALLLGGDQACLTGQAALIWRHLEHLPREVSSQPVDILVPASRHLGNTDWVRVNRTQRLPTAIRVDDVPTAPVSRAVVDAARWLSSYDSVLALVSCCVNACRTTVAQIQAELDAARVRGSRVLRQVLSDAGSGVRSIPEANARRLFRRHGLPDPIVNQPIRVNAETFIPDFRWGRVILEIDSRAWHLLEPGAWDRTQARGRRSRRPPTACCRTHQRKSGTRPTS